MQSSSSRKYEHRKKTKERSLKRRKAKSSDLWNSKNDPLDLENPESRLTKTNIKNILTEQVFRTLPLADQSKLLQLLPTCDRLLGPDTNLSVGQEAMNNEFFAKACIEWKERLADGDFTAETQVRCKLEREKRLHVDPWKKKYFESFWGEKLMTSTTTSMTVSSPILATSIQSSLSEKRPLLADLLTKVASSPHSTAAAAISLSSQQIREQLTLMLNNKSLHPLKVSGKAGVAASATVAKATVATTDAASTTVLPNRTFQHSDSTLHCKTSVNPRPGLVQICLTKNCVTSASGQLPNSVMRPIMAGPAILGKRTLNSDESCHSRPTKKSLIACKDLLSRSSDGRFSARSDSSNPKSESAASLMPVLASALLTNDSVSSTASLSSCIPTVVLMPKPGMASQGGLTSPKNQVLGLGHMLRSDSLRSTVQKELIVSASVPSKGAAFLHEELAGKFEAQSNRIKKNLFTSEDLSPRHQENFQEHIEKLSAIASVKDHGDKGRAAVGSQVVLSSGSLSASNSMLSSSLLNSLIMSNASFLSVPPGPNRINNFALAPSFLQQPQRLTVPSGSRDAFQVPDTCVNPVSAAAPKCVLPFLASQGENVYIVQQASSSPAVAKPLPPSIAFPNQAPLILVLANPSLPGMALAGSQLSQASLAAGAPKLAINTQPLELTFGNQSGSATPIVVTQASQSMIPSQTLLVGNKAVNHAFQTFTFASQAPQSFTVSSQAAKTLVVGSTPPAVTFSNRASLNCGGNTGARTFTVLNHGFQKLDSVSPTAGVAETAIPRQPTAANVGHSAWPMFFGNQASSERFVLANLSANQTSHMLNVNAHLKDNVGVTSLSAYNPPLDNQAIANQLPQLLVAISGASPQILCAAAKSSVGQMPVLGQLSFKAASTPPKIGPGSICMIRRPSPTESVQASPVPSVRCCNILQSPGGVQSASTPMILLQAPLSRTTAPSSSQTLVSLAIPASVSSLFSSAPRSSLITTASQQHPLMFQVVPENNIHTMENPQNQQRIILNTMPLNGGIELKTRPDGGEQTYVDFLRSCCVAPSVNESICSPAADNQLLGKSMHLLNGSRVKTITIKKLTPPVGHAASSTVTGQSSSLIKTLLTSREPEQLLYLSPDNHDILNSVFRVGRNACVVGDSTREMRRDGMGLEICKSCGSVIDRSSSAEAWNSVGVCMACHSSV